MKKLLTLALVVLLLCAMALSALAEKTLSIGIIQLADNGAFTDMREGFIARMRELGYGEDQMRFDYKNAQGDMSNLNAICQTLVEAQMDLIVSIATPATQAIVNMESGIPVFFISVSNPVAAGVITDMAKPDKNATGTSNAIPIDRMFALSEELTPDAKYFGVIYNMGEINAATTAKSAIEYMESNGYTYKEGIVTASSEVQQATQMLIDAGVQAIFVPNDSMVQSALPLVVELCNEAKIPVYGSSAVMVATGAFATISIRDTEIGAITADMVDAYLKGTKMEDIPAIRVSSFTTVINVATADAIGVTLSDDVLETAVLLGAE
jgi:putative ABC transport system substrate-binding protein